MKPAAKAFARYKSVILADKSRALPKSVLPLLEKELRAVISGYFEVKTVCADLDYDRDGNLWLTVESAVDGLKGAKPHSLPVLNDPTRA